MQATPARQLGYVRVATPTHDPQPQIAALTAYGVDPRRIFLDRAAASSGDRPELARLLDQLKPGDALVVWRLDRLGRSITHLVHFITDIGSRGIGIISLTEEIDTRPPAGRPQLHIFALLDALQRDLLRERTAVGLAAARACGRKGGRPSVMTIDKIEAVRQMLIQGRSKQAIAQAISVSRPTLYRHLRTMNNTTPNRDQRAN